MRILLILLSVAITGVGCSLRRTASANGSASTAGRSEELSIPDLKLPLVRIEPGSFVMGTPKSEVHRDRDERPHKVTLTEPYYLGATEVTQSQYDMIMGDNPSHFKGDDRPVESVSWEDAVEFCRRLTERERRAGRLPEGQEYRLPTEAEWEYACRAGSRTAYCFGNDTRALSGYAWFQHTSRRRTHDVGQKRSNAWGLYDMHGNVYEWCSDWYGDYPVGPVADPTGPQKGTSRVMRGGSWATPHMSCRSAARAWGLPSSPSHIVGFRVACNAPQINIQTGKKDAHTTGATKDRATDQDGTLQIDRDKPIETILEELTRGDGEISKSEAEAVALEVYRRLWGMKPRTSILYCELDKEGRIWKVGVWSKHPLAGRGCEMKITKWGHLEETWFTPGL